MTHGRYCLDCGTFITEGKRCARCQRRRNAKQDARRQQLGLRRGSTRQWRKTREQVLRRDGYACRVCGVSSNFSGARLEVHHVDGDPKNDRLWNLEVRCFAHNPRGG